MKPVSRDIAWLMVILVSFGTGIALQKYVFGVVNVQQFNMEFAQENIPRARAMLEKNSGSMTLGPSCIQARGRLGFTRVCGKRSRPR
jgi:hypothetical protein